MTLHLPLSAETEAKLRERAAASGKDVVEIVAEAIEEKLAADPDENGDLAPERWITEWNAWAANHRTLDSVADDGRESIYAGRGE